MVRVRLNVNVYPPPKHATKGDLKDELGNTLHVGLFSVQAIFNETATYTSNL